MIWSLYFKFKGRWGCVVSSAFERGWGLTFFNVRRWWLATERGSDSERAIERYAAECDGRRIAQHYFFEG